MRVLIILLLSSFVFAADITFLDAQTHEPIADSYVLIKLYQHNKLVFELSETTQRGRVTLPAPTDTYDAAIFIDTLATPGKDYYRSAPLTIDNVPKQLTVFPVGSLVGRTLQNEKTIASRAKLTFDCAKDFGIEYPSYSDELGMFSVAYMPTGLCRITSKQGNTYAISETTINHGTKSEITPILSGKIPPNYLFIYGSIALAVLAIALLIMRPLKRRAAQPTLPHQETAPEPAVPKRINDILKTLSADERKIVQFLLDHKFKATQPQIYRSTLIPRTSLARQIVSLEQKNILTSKRIRKIKEVTLTDWFVGEYKP